MQTSDFIFPKENYSLETITYKGHTVQYRFYKSIPYCTKPVDLTYQIINVKEPVSIDGKPVDASSAPVYFAIGCAGCLSTNPNQRGPGGPGGPGSPGAAMPKPASEITDGAEWEALAGGTGGPGPGQMGFRMLGGYQEKPMPAPGEGVPMGDAREDMLAIGFTVVEAGCRGRENQWPDGRYYGKAPAAIVDLKAAIRYIRHNQESFPGNPEKIIVGGGSGGGLMSTLVAASGNCEWFTPYLNEIGAAEERDDVFASYSSSPYIAHEVADGAVEWQGGGLLTDPEEKKRSGQLAASFSDYLREEQFFGKDGYGRLSIDNLASYIVEKYLAPDASRYLDRLSDTEKVIYLQAHPWLRVTEQGVVMDYADFGLYAPRHADVPSFDDLALECPCPGLYGDEYHNARHFTDFALRIATGDPEASVDQNLREIVHNHNPIWHILRRHSDAAPYWWIRHGACDHFEAVPMAVLLATAAENAGKDVNCRLVWDGGHCEDDDLDDFLLWARRITE